MSDRFQELGIPPSEITASVSIAINGLLEHIKRLNHDLQINRSEMEKLQSLVDVETIPTLPNRKSFIKRLEWSIAMAKRYPGPNCITIFGFNDYEELARTYGYQTAQQAASHVANTISQNIRDTDFFARLDTQQFGAIMYFADLPNVIAKCEKLCEQVHQAPFYMGSHLINIPIHFGVHTITPADEPESALLAAISSMFATKEKQKFEEINFKA